MVVLNEQDTRFKYEVAEEPGGENIKLCFTCGLCTASCPVADINPEFNPRKIIHMVLLGIRKEVLSSSLPWLCLNRLLSLPSKWQIRAPSTRNVHPR